MDFEKSKSKRSVVRTSLTKLITKIEGIIGTPISEEYLKETKIEELHVVKNQLLEKTEDLKALDDIIETLTDINEIEKEVSASDKYKENISVCKTKLMRCLESLEYQERSPGRLSTQTTPLHSNNSENRGNDHQTVKLPRLEIPTFSGDCSQFMDFWGQFEVAIDQNESLSKIEKLAYLKSYLKKTALSAISGFAITNENYDSCVKLLKDRFGRLDLIASSHLNKLMSMEPVKSASNIFALRKMYDNLVIEIRSLENLKIGADSYSNLICTVIMQKLPEELNLQFNRERKSNELFNVNQLIEFLKREIECREATVLFSNKVSIGTDKNDNTNTHYKQTNNLASNKFRNFSGYKKSTASNFLTDAENVSCLFCGKSHNDKDCLLTPIERRSSLSSQGRCYACFRRRHIMKNCFKKKEICRLCNKSNHNFLICDANIRDSKSTNVDSEGKAQTVNSLLCNEERPGAHDDPNILLQTFSASAKSENNEVFTLRALADNGSTRTFIKRETADLLRLRAINKELLTICTFGNEMSKEKIYDIVELKLFSLIFPNRCIKLKAIVIDSITVGKIKVPSAYVRNVAKRKGIKLADMGTSDDIQILIGSDYIWKILGERNVRLCNKIVASESPFGYMLQGIDGRINDKQTIVNHLTVINNDFDYGRVKDLWNLESIGINSDKEILRPDEDILKAFNETTTYENNRYEVELLWKDDHQELSSNFGVSKRRLFRLNNKFKRDKDLYLKYKNILNEQLKDDIIERVEHSDSEKQTGYFMPHHAVVKECKETTKVRICYDASSNSKGEISLNSCLNSGPNLNPDLVEILLKFRSYPIAFCADIQRAFLEVGICEKDRMFLKFLWGREREADLALDDPRIYQFKRVPFGVKCSPFLLAATLRLHSTKYKDKFPDASKMINDCYVDDLISGSDSVRNAAKVSIECTKILEEASMNLRQWATNSVVLRDIWERNGLQIKGPNEKDTITLTVLGLKWNNDLDSISVAPVNLEHLNHQVVTKRLILKACGMLFDPLGLLAPFSIKLKILLQSLWKKKIEWDDPIPPDEETQFEKWKQELPFTNKFTIPRLYFSEIPWDSIELHLFSDSSIKCYGACAYFRIVKPERCSTSFIISKSRLAPIKEVSLPRLELLGTLISARLGSYLQSVFPKLDHRKIFYWCDSQICLHWIRGNPDDWKLFVKNRVLEIQQKTDIASWHFCAGKLNPADKLTRGMNLTSLVNDDVWKLGPAWLSEPDLPCDPSLTMSCDMEGIQNEKRKIVTTFHVKINKCDPILNLEKYSNLNKALRITAYVLRFINNVKVKCDKISGSLTAAELSLSEMYWLRFVQRSAFSDEYHRLKTGTPIDSSSNLYTLSPILNDNELIVLKGRIVSENVDIQSRQPIILPTKARFTELLIVREHERIGHSGVSDTLTQLRERFWIIRCRQAVKSCLHKCVICKRFKAKAGQQVTAPLPITRTNEAQPFEVIGADFAGPLFTKDQNKVYIALFTCAVTRAVHLELVSSLNTNHFLLAFRRFVSRRGMCRIINSDNALTFKSADRELKRLYTNISDTNVQQYFANNNITWQFIVERAAWWGGYWERMVRMTKGILRKILGRALVTFEELQTILAEVEAILNSRPLTYVYNEPEEPFPLTPAHFLVGGRVTALPPQIGKLVTRAPSSTQTVLIKRYLYRERLLNQFWKRWKFEYLLQLKNVNIVKNINSISNFNVGDIVLINEERLPRLQWKLGRVIETHPGRDKKVRAVTLKTASGTIRRPIQLLYPLEVVDKR